MREEEREMIPFCRDENIAITPYSPLAARGRLSRHPDEKTKRSGLDQFAKSKYDATSYIDNNTIERVEILAKKKNVSMAEISLAWLLSKNTVPIIGATKKEHIESSVRSIHVKLSQDEINYLEELYTPHKLSGVMARNTPSQMFILPKI